MTLLRTAYALPRELLTRGHQEMSGSLADDSPSGIFHYSDTDNSFHSSFKLPDFEALDPIRVAGDLMSAAATAETRRKSMSGVNLPLPFVGKPINFQMTGESRSGLSFTEKEKAKTDGKADMSPKARKAFQQARHLCLHGSTASCDEALDTFYRVKFGSSLVNTDPVRKVLEDDPTTSFAKLFVPTLEERLNALNEDSVATSTPTSSSVNEEENVVEPIRRQPVRERHPLTIRRHPFSNVHALFHPLSRSRKIHSFLRRIS
ncbi:hypothetical protein Q1695_009363 [Nippostrongylus brasiliensis]|nr:hypothetical protein Q1695_009363 [Nippostrongylus brasiliensis]